jgi:hypothetical protein
MIAGGGEESGMPATDLATHTEDYRSVRWYGTVYTFTVNQARCIEFLWNEAVKGRTILTQEAIVRKVFDDDIERRLRDVFKGSGSNSMHPAWGTMIVQARKGMYGLSRPVPPDPNEGPSNPQIDEN